MKQQAILILTSEGAHPGLRAASGTGWIKLFQAADYYLDLSYKQEGQQGFLFGQVLREGGVSLAKGRATLLDPQGTPLQTAELSPKAGFRLPVGDLTAHRLELTLGQATFDVALS